MKERSFWIGFMLLMAVALAGPPDTAALSPAAPAAVALAAQDAPKPSVDINITKTERGDDWYKNPIIIGAGVVILVLLVALASRGGSGTTVVKS